MMKAVEVESPLGADEEIAGVPCRVFRATAPARGTYLHIHGGGLTLGSPRMNDLRNADICERQGVDVVSVDYRLAPEHPHPAAADDCLAVAAAVLDREPGPVAIGGESAGGYLAAVTLLRLRDEVGAIDRIAGANLTVGFYDMSATPSHRGVRPIDLPDVLEPGLSGTMRAAYIPGVSIEESRDPVYSPLFAPLHDLPPALFSAGLADHLLDDSLFMHAALAGVGEPGGPRPVPRRRPHARQRPGRVVDRHGPQGARSGWTPSWRTASPDSPAPPLALLDVTAVAPTRAPRLPFRRTRRGRPCHETCQD